MKTKVCSKCKIEKSFSEFYKGNDKYGLQYHCKLCFKYYYKDNVGPILKRQKQYNKNNADLLAKYQKQYDAQQNKNATLFENYSKKLEQFEEIRPCPENLELLEAKCAYYGTTRGEHRFYCSENCKQSCPIYNQKKYPKDFKKATSREVVPLLRQLVLERDDYTCQKCGATTDEAQLHVHHILSYILNKIMANDPDNCITLCKECHKWVHSRESCRNVDLQCSRKKGS